VRRENDVELLLILPPDNTIRNVNIVATLSRTLAMLFAALAISDPPGGWRWAAICHSFAHTKLSSVKLVVSTLALEN
jgi:hypothetical protein